MVPGPVTQALSSAARQHAMVLVIGVNERDGGTLYNAQLVFDADGTMLLKRRKITPTYHERMIWGQGDGAGLKVVDTAVGRVGALACWEHYNPLARYALMAQGEEIHAAQFPGSLVGQIFADQMEVTIRHHALEAGCFVVNATGWLSDEQIDSISTDPKMQKGLRGGNCTAIVSPEGRHLVPPMTSGEGLLIADCDMALITKRKRMMDAVGHYARPELLQLHHDARATSTMVQHGVQQDAGFAAPVPQHPAASAAASTPKEDHEELPTERLINELQSFGVRLADGRVGAQSRRGGAGPSDHKAVTIAGRTVMVPIHTAASHESPYSATRPGVDGVAMIERDGIVVGRMTFPRQPRFYALQTFDGIPYPKIAVLHSKDVLATTVLQTCIRYQSRAKTCQFCAIGQSLAAGRTIAHKTPEQLAEVARAAVLLDGVKHMVMTTGTPNATDRGAAVLCESAFAIRARVDLPIQAQCEPPRHRPLVRADEGVRHRHARHAHRGGDARRARPHHAGQGERAAGALHEGLRGGRAGVRPRTSLDLHPRRLGDTPDAILEMAAQLVARGVYPFVVPFVPIAGTPLEDHPTPSPAFMHAVLEPLAAMLRVAGMSSGPGKAGCAKCGACSALSTYERSGNASTPELPIAAAPRFVPAPPDLILEGVRA